MKLRELLWAVGIVALAAGCANGEGGGENDAKSFEQTKEGAEGGDAMARRSLGFMYREGWGVEKDEEEVVRWDKMAFKSFMKAAEQGDALAQWLLGCMYSYGQGVEKNSVEALRWFKMSAAQGDAWRQGMLAHMHVVGQNGIEKDAEEAAKWYKMAFESYMKSAERGDAEAQLELGHKYQYGQGVEKDEIEAVKWYTRAAENGQWKAQQTLGDMYREGVIVSKDVVKAYMWYSLAAVEILHQKNYRYGLERTMTEEELAEAKRRAAAFKWKGDYLTRTMKRAEQGNVQAQKTLGRLYTYGAGVEQDDVEALTWYRRAAEQGDVTQQVNLGFMYRDGRGVERDYVASVKWFTGAAEQGNAEAQVWLGRMYKKGEGVEKDFVESARWFRAAAESGDFYGQMNLGRIYAEGRGVEKDLVEAYLWYRLVSKKDPREKAYVDLEKEMSKDEVAEAKRRVAEFKPRSWEEIQAEMQQEQR
ncbi:MAG: hypothetical protein L3K26_04020 [Candidatus Hydrogenedentes bacterium]|nr:hypothetical protein [Candidatus Hydrogenedentota bacterium]